MKNPFWADDSVTLQLQIENKKAVRGQEETLKLIDSIGGLHGNVLDIGGRNLVTELLEARYDIEIDSTWGDLDLRFNSPKKEYDFIHYNNVIEHQFNPLFTLLEIKKRLKPGGILILATPLKPTWITFARCHFFECDKYMYKALIDRSGFTEIKRVHYYYQISIKGIRILLGSFYKRQVVSLLKSNK